MSCCTSCSLAPPAPSRSHCLTFLELFSQETDPHPSDQLMISSTALLIPLGSLPTLPHELEKLIKVSNTHPQPGIASWCPWSLLSSEGLT